MIHSPFKFLDSYTKDDSKIFFGREQETEDLYRKIFENKTLLVYGVSGTGKTSIINCGLANKFNDADWLPVTIRRNQNMVESFYAALHKLSPDVKDKGKRDAKAFIKLLQSVYLDHFKPVYLLFDQFEELFIFGDEEEQEAFVDIIAQIKASDVQVKILFIMREEYLANMSAFEEKIPDLLTNRLRIEKMSTAKVKEAITGPCNYAEIGIENEAVEAIIEKLTRQGKTIELTYLQVLLDRLFHKAAQEQKGDNLQFTQKLVASLGEVSDILGDFLEEQISQFDNPDQVLDVLKSFVSIRGTKRQSTVEEIGNHLRSLNKAQETDTLQNTIQQLVNLRILREKDENDRYELRHDALAMKIYEKVTLVEKELLEVRDFLDNALNNFQKRGRLLTVEDLKYIAPYEEKMFMAAEMAKLVENSKREVEKTRKRRRKLIFVSMVVLLAIFAGFTWWALSAKKIAEEQLYESIQSSLAISTNKGQILYYGIPNPVTISVSGVDKSRIIPESDDAVIRGDSGLYEIIPRNRDLVKINVRGVTSLGDTVDFGNKQFRVKLIPVPTIKVSYLRAGKGGVITKERFNRLTDITSEIENLPFDIEYKVSSYTFQITNSKGYILFQELVNDCNISESIKNAVQKTSAGNFIHFKKIAIIGTEKRPYYMGNVFARIVNEKSKLGNLEELKRISYEFKRKKEWLKYARIVSQHDAFFQMDESLLNLFAENIYLHVDNPFYLNIALQWSSKAVEFEKNWKYMKTKGAILKKLGNTKQSLRILEKALVLAKEQDARKQAIEEINELIRNK